MFVHLYNNQTRTRCLIEHTIIDHICEDFSILEVVSNISRHLDLVSVFGQTLTPETVATVAPTKRCLLRRAVSGSKS